MVGKLVKSNKMVAMFVNKPQTPLYKWGWRPLISVDVRRNTWWTVPTICFL